jgi:4,5-DOPA dioxygenase extradiol
LNSSALIDRLPAVYLSHGAPPLIDDPVWSRQLLDWGQRLGRPNAILVVSAHWESAPLTIGATQTVPLVYDFDGFPKRYYQITYPVPGAPELAERVRRLVGQLTPVAEDPTHGLDHGAYVPLLFMYPRADVPVLQISMPSEDPRVLIEIGRRLAPLRDEGVLLMGSGFMTHSFAAFAEPSLPSAIREFDAWAAETLAPRPGHPRRLPPHRPRSGLCPSDARPLRAAIRDPRRQPGVRRRRDDGHRRLLVQQLQALDRASLAAKETP